MQIGLLVIDVLTLFDIGYGWRVKSPEVLLRLSESRLVR